MGCLLLFFFLVLQATQGTSQDAIQRALTALKALCSVLSRHHVIPPGGTEEDAPLWSVLRPALTHVLPKLSSVDSKDGLSARAILACLCAASPASARATMDAAIPALGPALSRGMPNLNRSLEHVAT